MVKTKTQIKHDLRLAFIFLLIGIVGTSIVWVYASPLSTYYIAGGIYPTADYTIWKEGTSYYAKSKYGQIPSWGNGDSNASYVINSALSSLTSGRVWKEKVLLKDAITITHTLKLPNYTIFNVEGSLTLANNADCNMIENVDLAKGSKYIDIVGGYYDGNKANQASGSIIYLSASSPPSVIEKTRIEGTTLHGAKQCGIYGLRCAQIHICQNIIRTCNSEAIKLQSFWDSLIYANDIYYNNQNETGVAEVNLRTCQGNLVSNNKIGSSTLQVVALYEAERMTIENNILYDAGYLHSNTYPILLLYGSGSVNSSTNIIAGNSFLIVSWDYAKYGVLLQTTSDHNFVTANIFNGTWGTSAYYDSGISNNITGNHVC